MQEASLYDRLDNQNVHCQVCNHFCTIAPGQVGVCGVRQNNQGKLYSLVYSKAVDAHVDPIEKKPLYHFLPGSRALSIGTFGCNFKCDNCLNWRISQIYEYKRKVDQYDQINWGKNLPPEKIVQLAVNNNCQSIAYTYNEPTVFFEYALKTMKLAHEKGIKNVWVSNGFMSAQVLDKVIPYLDGINVDIKSMEDEFYKKICGGRVKPVLENCRWLAQSDVWLEVTTLIIPNLSDDPAMLKQLAEFIKNKLGKNVPWHLISFSADISWQMKDHPDTQKKAISRAYQIGKKAGLNYIYGGNISGAQMQTTKCPQCEKAVIKRRGYNIENNLSGNRCPNCSLQVEGVFS
jgi:pyruvate formate lyase activating enzyme